MSHACFLTALPSAAVWHSLIMSSRLSRLSHAGRLQQLEGCLGRKRRSCLRTRDPGDTRKGLTAQVIVAPSVPIPADTHLEYLPFPLQLHSAYAIWQVICNRCVMTHDLPASGYEHPLPQQQLLQSQRTATPGRGPNSHVFSRPHMPACHNKSSALALQSH